MHTNEITETILICGGSGFLGSLLRPFFIKKGYKVWILSRNKNQEFHFEWDPELKKFPLDILPKVDHIINLSGANLMRKSWSNAFKKEIIRSRVLPTQFIREILENNPHKVKSVTNASGISIYGDRGDVIITEQDEPGTGYLEKVCVNWEFEAKKIRKLGIRTNILRISPIIHEDNDFIKSQMKFAKFGLLGSVGKGNQYIPWIHFEDILNIFHFVMVNSNCNTEFNTCTPNPVRQKDLNTALGEKIDQKQFAPPLPMPIFRLALGEKSKLVTDSIHAIPENLIQHGFVFKYPKINEALEHLS